MGIKSNNPTESYFNFFSESGSLFVVRRTGPLSASGGTKVTSPTYITHFFTSSGSFVVDGGSDNVEYLMVAGGGSGGGTPPASAVVASGGGGGGGVISSLPEGPGGPGGPTRSASSQPMNVGSYAVTVGSGGVGGPTSPSPRAGQPGNDSVVVFSPTVTLTAKGGAEGGTHNTDNPTPQPAYGSGGGGGYDETPDGVLPGYTGDALQGYAGGNGAMGASGGGGGADATGNSTAQYGPPANGGNGGAGKGFANIPTDYGTSGPSPTLRYFAAGGGGGSEQTRLPSVFGVGGEGGGGENNQRQITLLSSSTTPEGDADVPALKPNNMILVPVDKL